MFKKLLVIAALLGTLLALPAAASAATGAISGEVSESTSGNPVPEAHVCAEQQSGEFERFCTFTFGNGTYTLGGLAAGTYSVEFSRGESGRNLVPQYYEVREGNEPPDPVTVFAGTTTTEIDADLAPGGGIEGRVTAAVGGAPIREVEVCAEEVGGGEVFGGCTETDANGDYTLLGLGAGEYAVGFYAGYLGYETQLYDGARGFAEATLVPVAVGAPVSGIDAALVRGAEISGHVYSAASGAPLRGILVCAFVAGSPEPRYCTESRVGGAYSLQGLSEGSYKVGFSLEFREFFPEAEPEPDGWPSLYWNQQPTLAAANAITVARSGTAAGIDARLGSVAAASIVPPAIAPVTPIAKPKPTKRCRKGFRRQKRTGKVRCVRVHRNHHRLHRRRSS